MKNWIFYITAILLAVDNVFISKRIGFLSIDRLMEIMIFLLFFRSFLNEFQSNPFFRKFCQFLIGFIVLKFLMNLWFLAVGEIKSMDLVKEIFKGITFIIFSYLFVLVLKKGTRYLRVISWVHLGIIIFALLHHPLSPVAAQVQDFKKELLTSNDADMGEADLSNEETYIEYGMANRFRLSGPFAFAITYSYFAISSFILNLFLFMKTRKKFYLLVLGLLIVTAFLSQTRSLILGMFIVSAGYFLLIQNKTARYKFNLFVTGLFSILILVLASHSLSTIDSRVTSTESTGGGSDNRPWLWATGILAVLENPFGVTESDYDKTRRAMFEASGDSSLLILTSHNGLINVGFQYTFFGYILFAFFIFFLIRQAKELPKDYKYLFYLSLFGYWVHTSFHNNFILYADYPFLMILILIGYANAVPDNPKKGELSMGLGN